MYWAVPKKRLDDYPDVPREIQRDKGSWVTAIALGHALRQAAIGQDAPAAERLGLVLGCGLAGQLGMIDFANEVREQSARFVSPIHFPQTVGNYIAGALARGYGIRGPNLTLASGRASGLDAIVEARELLDNGSADVVIAGGTDVLSKELAQGLAEPGALLSEGACLFVLESAERAAARGIVPLAMLAGRDQPPGGHSAPSPATAILSTPSTRHPGAIFIEHWIGRCPGAAGAASVAAAIGAAGGYEVPTIDPADIDSVVVQRVTATAPPETAEAVPALVFTEIAMAKGTTLGLAIPRKSR